MLAGGFYERTSGAAGQPLVGYRRRAPEHTVLHELVSRHAQTMITELRDADVEGVAACRATSSVSSPRTSVADSSRMVFRPGLSGSIGGAMSRARVVSSRADRVCGTKPAPMP